LGSGGIQPTDRALFNRMELLAAIHNVIAARYHRAGIAMPFRAL
jgi:small-conductance mechanosensitive channel